jgi:carboxylate-amine ligase
MDAQTRVEETLALAGLCQVLVKSLYDRHAAGERFADAASEMLDENKWLAARYGLDAELVDLPHTSRITARELLQRELPVLREHAQQLGCEPCLKTVTQLLETGNGAQRQLATYRDSGRLSAVMTEIVELTQS